MEQEKIWDYFQNEGLGDGKFPEARQRFMLRFLQAGTSVLNVGVGAGALERLGLEKGVQMYALDPSEKAIERLRESLGMAGRAQAGYAQAIPFPDGSFDMVVMSEVLEHLDDAVLAQSLLEVHRVLKPSGSLLASTPYREDLGAKHVVCPQCGSVFHHMGHMQSFDKPRMRLVIEQSGLRVQRLWVSTFIDWRRQGAGSFLKSLIRLALARMGEGIADPHLLVIAKKRR
jgi:SAM-dependent methyltransferase